jgi:hypothetical protein
VYGKNVRRLGQLRRYGLQETRSRLSAKAGIHAVSRGKSFHMWLVDSGEHF